MFHPITSRIAVLEIAKRRNEFVREDRMVGTTTGLALRFLGEAILEPGLTVAVHDHEGTDEADHELLSMMMDIAKRLELRGLIFDEEAVTVRFTLDW